MISSRDLHLHDGRVLRVHDAGGPEGAPVVLWHQGSPQTGAPLAPLLAAASERGIRLLSYGRPSYGGSTPSPGRDVASAASDVGQLADALGIGRFAVMGASGGGPHALACAALLPGRVTAAACLASPSPFVPDDPDWFAGMASDGASLRAALAGREARELHEATTDFDPESFIAEDYAALDGEWAALGADVAVAAADGPGGLIDDDLAFVRPWGFDPGTIAAPVLLVQGGRDRVIPAGHSERLAALIGTAEVWRRPDGGHISILRECPAALDWLRAHS